MKSDGKQEMIALTISTNSMCIFCQLASGALPCEVIYEDDLVLGFLDIKPLNPGHALVIPKAHRENLEELDTVTLEALIRAASKIGRKMKESLGVSGYNVSLNNGVVAGQEVMHVHFHIIPRQENDGLKPWPRREYAPGEREALAKKLAI